MHRIIHLVKLKIGPCRLGDISGLGPFPCVPAFQWRGDMEQTTFDPVQDRVSRQSQLDLTERPARGRKVRLCWSSPDPACCPGTFPHVTCAVKLISLKSKEKGLGPIIYVTIMTLLTAILGSFETNHSDMRHCHPLKLTGDKNTPPPPPPFPNRFIHLYFML